MVDRLVAVDEAGNLPPGVVSQIVAPLRGEFTDLRDAASGYAGDAQAAASRASAAATQAEAAIGQTNKRAISLSRLPINASGIISYNGAAHSQDNLTVHNGVQYAVWWSHDLKPIIGRRVLPNGRWTTKDLSTVSGNPLASPVALDGHNVLSVAVDSAGFIHVWGNQHGNVLRYTRSSAADNIANWVTGTMVGTNETQMTYPVPFKTANGTLYFIYREGVSGNGDYYLNRYNTANKTWVRVHRLFNGLASSECAYLNKVVPDNAGNTHFFFTWRGSGNATSNNDFCYARMGQDETIKQYGGAAQTVPITHANSEVILDTATTGAGILNQQGTDVDSNGVPHAAMWLYDSNGNTQIYHFWPDAGGTWQYEPVTNLDRRIDLNVSTFQPSLSRAQVVCPANGGTYIVYRSNFDGKGGRIRAIDVSDKVEFPLIDLDMSDWEPTFDTQANRLNNEMSMLLVQTAANWQNTTSSRWNHIDNWNNQVALVATIDLAQILQFKAGRVRLPRIEPVANQAGPPEGITITATTSADFKHGPIAIMNDDAETYFVRLTNRSTAAATTTTTVTVYIASDPGGIMNRASTVNNGVSNQFNQTVWVNAYNTTGPLSYGYAQVRAHRTGTGTNNVSVALLEIGRLVGLTD